MKPVTPRRYRRYFKKPIVPAPDLAGFGLIEVKDSSQSTYDLWQPMRHDCGGKLPSAVELAAISQRIRDISGADTYQLGPVTENEYDAIVEGIKK